MKTSNQIRLFFFLMIILICPMEMLYSRLEFKSNIQWLSGAERLISFNVDTTNEVLISQIADSANHRLNDYACLFLAQHGKRDILPKLQTYFNQAITGGQWQRSYYLLASIISLENQQAFPYVTKLLDSMIVQNREFRAKYYADQFADIIGVLLDFNDYSQYELFKNLFEGYNRPAPSSIQTFYRFAKDPTKESDAFGKVKSFVNDQNADVRYYALMTLNWFENQPTSLQIFRQASLEDSSIKNRDLALHFLLYKGLLTDVIPSFKEIAKNSDTLYSYNAVSTLEAVNSPYALKALVELKDELSPGPLLEDLKLGLKVCITQPHKNQTITWVVNFLESSISQCASFAWIGNQAFVTQLTQYVKDSKIPLSAGDSVNCAQKIRQFQQSIDKEYKDTLNITSNFITWEGWKFLHYNAQYILDRLPQIPPTGCNVKLVNSTGTKLTSGSLQYYEGSPQGAGWKDAVNNNDGNFAITTTAKTLSLRMTYEYGTQTKSNVSISNDTIVFQTVNAQIQLQNSSGVLIDTGSVQYYDGAWRNLGTTINGIATKELLPNNYSFRMTYAYASKDKQQDISTNPTVVFQTVNAAVQLQNSQGTLIDQGTVQYYSGAWRDLGTTASGIAKKELLPNNYSFRMTYAFASKDKQQDIGTNATVVFQTVNAAVQLKNSLGNLIDQGTVQYYSGAWRDLGVTTNGTANKELLPNNYSFRMTYAYASKDKQQDITTNATVVFQTVNAAVQLQNSQGTFIDQGTVQYYSGAWRDLGTTTNGIVRKELLPNNYSFRMTYEYVSLDKAQDISTNNTVSFSTVLCTIRVKNSQNQLVNNAMTSYYSGAWRQIGNTVNGVITKELFPVNLSFRVKYGTQQQDKQQNLSTNAVVEFGIQ